MPRFMPYVTIAGCLALGWLTTAPVHATGTVYLKWDRIEDAEKPIISYGTLDRERARQSLLIAAQHELGLNVLDGTLADPEPGPDATDAVVIDCDYVRVAPYDGGPETLTLHRPDRPELGELEVTYPVPGGIERHRDALPHAEKATRDMAAALKAFGLEGEPLPWNPDAAVPAPAEEHMQQMNFLDQFITIKLLHEAMAADGESVARLTTLSRAYANLGQLCLWHWRPHAKVFWARALLYAQRAIVRGGSTPETLWTRAYALAMTGLPNAAMKDGQSAGARADDADVAAPFWAELIEPLCKYDQRRLREMTEQAPNHRQLAAFMTFMAVRFNVASVRLVEYGDLRLRPLRPERAGAQAHRTGRFP